MDNYSIQSLMDAMTLFIVSVVGIFTISIVISMTSYLIKRMWSEVKKMIGNVRINLVNTNKDYEDSVYLRGEA